MNTRLDILLRASLNISVACALDVITARQDEIFKDFWFVWSTMLVFSGDISSIALGVWPLTLYRNILSKQLSGIWAGQVGSILRSQLMACNLDHNWIRLCFLIVIMSRFWFHIGFQLPCGALWLLGAGLGPPGNDGASWAGDATVLFNEAARRLETRDFGAIFSKFFGFTEAKQCQEAQEDFLQTITEWKPRSWEVL